MAAITQHPTAKTDFANPTTAQIIFLLLNTIIYLLAKVNTHDDLTQTTKNKGHDAQTSQPFKH